MREALRGLTTRGRSFLAASVAATISAGILGEKDLLRVAVLLGVLPLLAAGYVGRSRYKLACSRSLDPHRVPVGASSRVLLRLQNLSRLPTGTLLLEDRLPYALGSRPRVVLERLGANQASSVAYTVRADVRGRYEVGPLIIRLTDPFGLCELSRSFPSVDQLTVIPQVTALPSVRLAGEYAGAGESRARSVAVHGEDDAATREYRRGDDLRRVHWRSTARTGELMVRREEQPWESRATVVLDTRAAAHLGDGPTASFEWAVSADRQHRGAPAAEPATSYGWSPAPESTPTRTKPAARACCWTISPTSGRAARATWHGWSSRSGNARTAGWSSPCSARSRRPRPNCWPRCAATARPASPS